MKYFNTYRQAAAVVLAFIFISLPSCTRNNGDIGPWFGTWELTEIYVDGVEDPAYPHNIFWSFQGDVIAMISDFDTLNYLSSWGTWEEKDNTLILKFIYSDDAGEDFIYTPLPRTHLPYGISVLQIDKMNGKNLELTYVSPDDGAVYRYTFRKQV